jgi:hypothetical protein
MRTARRVVRWGMMDTFLGAASGAIFGGVFGGFGHLVHFNLSPILSIAGYFAFCGGAAGALVGMCGGMIDPPDASETASPLPTSGGSSARQKESDRASDLPRHRQPQNRLASDLTTVTRRKELVASQSPSWN